MLSNALLGITQKGGKIISIKYLTASTGSIYDEADVLTQSGNTVWTSGIVFTLDPNSSEDNLLLEQGKIAMNDQKLYTHGSLIYSPTTGSTIQTKIGLGSPGTDFFSLIPLGANSQEVEGTLIYKKAYIRKLLNGSLIGE